MLIIYRHYSGWSECAGDRDKALPFVETHILTEETQLNKDIFDEEREQAM